MGVIKKEIKIGQSVFKDVYLRIKGMQIGKVKIFKPGKTKTEINEEIKCNYFMEAFDFKGGNVLPFHSPGQMVLDLKSKDNIYVQAYNNFKSKDKEVKDSKD